MADDAGDVAANEGKQMCECLGTGIAKIVGCCCCVVVVVVVGVVSWFFATGQNLANVDVTDVTPQDVADGISNTVGDVTDSVQDIWQDPWGHGNGGNGSGPDKNIYWYTAENIGLQLPIQNALSQDWYTYLEDSVAEWENGTPDALQLSSEVVDDPNCEHVKGVLKVCNGDYGDTGWNGINEVLLTDDNFIVASRAKMNEFYLAEANGGSEALRQYTMCHELGHGFGLNHADETFGNPNLGTCMDYTDDPGVNATPNQKDYEQLRDWYGTVPANGTSAEQPQIYNIQSAAVKDGSAKGGEDAATLTSESTTGIAESVVVESKNSDATDGGERRRSRKAKSAQETKSVSDVDDRNHAPEKQRRLRESTLIMKQQHLRLPSVKEILLPQENNDIPHVHDIPSFDANDPSWRLVHCQRGRELHVNQLSNGYKVIARLMLN